MWIKESMKRSRKLKDHFNLNGVSVIVKDRLPDDVSLEFVLNYIAARVPFYFTQNIEVIYVGKFPEMDEREINAFYENDAIYVTNEQEEEMDMIEDIIHEISHAVEQNNQEFIYESGKLQREFIAKRTRLSQLLSQKYDVPPHFDVSFDYDKSIDDFLFRDVGYDSLNQICVNIFPSGYAATSVSEYWAKGFEELFIGDRDALKQMCPILFKTLALMLKEFENEN